MEAREEESPALKARHFWRTRTPTVIQMEAVECGAAALSIILSHFGRYVPLEELRIECGVSRDGSNALNLVKAARKYGLEGHGYRLELEDVFEVSSPAILFWEFNHFLVLDGFGKECVYLNDPSTGPRTVSYEEFDQGYIGIVLLFEPQESFQKGGKPPSIAKELFHRLKSVHSPLLYLFLAGLCLLIPGLALPAFTRIFIDNLLIAHLVSWKWDFLFAILIAVGFQGVLTALQNHFLTRLNGKLSLRFSSDFLWHILRLPLSFYAQRYTGEIAYRTNFNNKVSQQLTGPLATISINLLLILFYGLIMFQYDLIIAWIGILAALFNLGMMLLIQRARTDAYSRLQQERSKALGNALGGLQHIETIKATGTESDFFARFSGYFTKNVNVQQEISRKDALLSTFPLLFQSLAVMVLLSLGALRAIQGDLTVGMLIAFQMLLMTFLKPVGKFVNFGQMIQTMKIDIGRLNDVLFYPIDRSYLIPPAEDLAAVKKLKGRLEFKNVVFGYSPLSPPLIENLSFIIKPGQRLALVGPTGCGKSTLAKLAAGLYFPWSGEILYDGQPYAHLNREALHHSLAAVDQEIFLFSGTIRDNLTLWDKTVEEQILLQATQDACIHEEILLRQRGYNTLLTEAGRNLSGGQRQRLEIARSLVSSPSLLILDEATSSLDSETEKEISDNLRRRGCSCLMIAHRLSTIQDCDEILVLKEGKLQQRGTHETLKQIPGLYQDLVKSETFYGSSAVSTL